MSSQQNVMLSILEKEILKKTLKAIGIILERVVRQILQLNLKYTIYFISNRFISNQPSEPNLLSNLFFLSGLSFTNILDLQDSSGRGMLSFNSSLPFPPSSRTLRQQPGNYCREFTSAHSQQPDSNREFLVSECKLSASLWQS